MALNAPPPYEDITGISRVVMKDNAQETLANYNGNARPGEIVVNLEVDPPTLFVGNNAGFLTQIGTGNGGGGDYSNANVAAFLPTYSGNISANVMFANTANVNFITNEFPVRIVTNGGETWEFAGNILRGPEGGSWQDSADTIYFNSPANGYVNISSFNNGNIVSEIFMEHSFIRFFVDNGTPEKNWQMNLDGSFSVPGNIVGNVDPFNSGSLQWIGNSSGDGNGYTTLELRPDNTLTSTDQYLIIDPTAPSHIHIRAGGTQDASAAELYLGGENNYVRVQDGSGIRLQNQTRDDSFYYYSNPVDFNTSTWYEDSGTFFVEYTTADSELVNVTFEFNNDSENTLRVYYNGGADNALLTSAGSISSLGGGVYRVTVNEAPPASPTVITALEYNIWSNRTNSLQLSSNDFTVSVTDDIRITGRDTFSLRNESTTDPITIRTDYNGDDYSWEFGADGNLTAPGNISTAGSVNTGGNINFTSAEATDTARIFADVAGSNTKLVLEVGDDNADSIVLRHYSFADNNTIDMLTAQRSSSTQANVSVAGNITATGNITAANLTTKFTGSWTVPAGNSTQSFTVDGNHTYQMWVEGNIPNGIIAWNALVTVTNTNVPVLGQQFAWNYEGGGNVLMFNTIPAQIIGTAGTISNAEPAVSNTNVFSFGINNASGNTITVDYGWVRIS